MISKNFRMPAYLKVYILLIVGCTVVILGTQFPADKISVVMNSEGPLRIGAVLPLTGKFANVSEDLRNALSLAMEKLGDKVYLEIEDSAAEAPKGISAMNNLIYSRKSQIVFSGTGSTVNIAMSPVALKAKVPYFALTSTPVLIGKDDYTFTLLPVVTKEVLGMSAFLSSKRSADNVYKNGGVIYDTTSDTLSIGAKTFAEDFTKLGGSIVSQEGYAKDIEYNTIATKVIHSKPDFVYMLSTDKSMASIINTLRKMGYKGTIVAFSGVESDEFLKMTDGYNEGVLLSSIPFECDLSNARKEYCEKYRKQFNKEPQPYGSYVYDAVVRAVSTYEACPEKEGEGFKKCLLDNDGASKTLETLTESFGFDQFGDLSAHIPMHIKEIRDGKFVRVN